MDEVKQGMEGSATKKKRRSRKTHTAEEIPVEKSDVSIPVEKPNISIIGMQDSSTKMKTRSTSTHPAEEIPVKTPNVSIPGSSTKMKTRSTATHTAEEIPVGTPNVSVPSSGMSSQNPFQTMGTSDDFITLFNIALEKLNLAEKDPSSRETCNRLYYLGMLEVLKHNFVKDKAGLEKKIRDMKTKQIALKEKNTKQRENLSQIQIKQAVEIASLQAQEKLAISKIEAQHELEKVKMRAEHDITERELFALHAEVCARGYIGFMESKFFPPWMIGQKHMSRFMKWVIALEFKLSPQLTFIRNQLEVLNLEVLTVAQTIADVYREVSVDLHPIKALKQMDDGKWVDLFKKLGVEDDREQLCLKVVLSPIIRADEIITTKSTTVASGSNVISNFVLDIQSNEVNEKNDIDCVRQVLSRYLKLINIEPYREANKAISRWIALVGPMTMDDMKKKKPSLSAELGMTIYSHFSKC